MKPEDLKAFFEQFQDFMAPKLDTYEQAIYLYVFRHTRLIGQAEAVIPLKSARSRMACGVGEAGKPMSEASAYQRIRSLARKGFISLVQTEHRGSRIRLHLPSEIEGVVPPLREIVPIDVEEMDFYEDARNRARIFEREQRKCFYTLKLLDESSFVIDHVISRPRGGNGYRNVVAASREANNRKGSKSAEDFIRQLFREGLLSESECRERLETLERLREGHIRPDLDGCP